MRLALGKEIKVGDFLTHVNGKAVSAGDYGGIRETLMGSGEVGLTLRQLI